LEKFRSQEIALTKPEKGLLRDYETAFCSVLALMVLGFSPKFDLKTKVKVKF
jgi:hypothetical protein